MDMRAFPKTRDAAWAVAATSILMFMGVSLTPAANAQEESRSVAAEKRCSRVELERMVREPFASCPGSFEAFSSSKFTEKEAKEVELEAQSRLSSPVTNGIVLFCGLKSNGDYVHLSSTPGDVSGHGWWEIVSGLNYNCPDTAYVSIWVQGYYCDSGGCRWITIGTDAANIGPKAVTGQRVTGRAACTQDGRLVGYRSIVQTIDLNNNRSSTYNTPVQNLYCYPI
jgi:hypothetical protein